MNVSVSDELSAPPAGFAATVLLAVIGFYRVAISPIRPPSCRYVPSCSEYAVDAVRSRGAARGSWLALRRLLRCHPWHAGGLDPVPPGPGSSKPAPSNGGPVTSAPSLPRAAA